jgi:predicted kinase
LLDDTFGKGVNTPLRKLVRTDFSSGMPRLKYAKHLTMWQRLQVFRFLLKREHKSLPLHVQTLLTPCERLLAETNETISNKVPPPFPKNKKTSSGELVRKKSVETKRTKMVNDLSMSFYGKGAPRKDKVLHIVIGPPGSGKSSRMVEPLQEKYGAMVIDSDHYKPFLPHFYSGYGGVAVHPESMEIAFKVLKQAFENGDNIVYPTTGGNLERMKQFIEQARGYGYKVGLHLVDLPVKESVQRSVQRSLVKDSKGHFQLVSPDYVVDVVGEAPKAVFDRVVSEDLVDEYSHISTANLKKGEKAPVVRESKQKISDLLKPETE